MQSVAVVIPAKDEAQRIAATVRAAGELPGVDLVVVVDDGSSDRTGELAAAAGATVVRHPVPHGKAGAMETGGELVRVLEARDGATAPRALLFLDADLEASAAAAGPLVPPVLAGAADMTIAVLPPQRRAGGGHGLVVRLARDGIRAATGWEATQPLSGQRCLTREAFEAALPLAPGFGVETGLTVDLLRRGLRVREVEVDLHHRVTGTDLRAQLHRARQWRDVARALAARRVVPRRARG
ncbi:glycosyltransferase family 2 protein [Vallicoccus soli]|uniref:glycosyltransferase family 2 protein n=1 Tax=Vallicoccus soli TaxID=2339232 RepID=UPI001C49B7C3|nr:glycosyltransferase [Vallicoccus soli]